VKQIEQCVNPLLQQRWLALIAKQEAATRTTVEQRIVFQSGAQRG
jgi:hypothetical protein